jgi:hypothetical protein
MRSRCSPPLSHRAAQHGASREVLQTEILADHLIVTPWPRVWTHLEGGSVKDPIASYRKLTGCRGTMNRGSTAISCPRAGAESVVAGHAEAQDVVDPWKRRLRRYAVGRFEMLTR